MKTCNQCNEIKNLSDFSKYKSSKDGYKNKCKLCTNNNNKKYKERSKEYNKKYFQKNKEILTIKNKNYRKNNLVKIKAHIKLYRDKNKEHIKKKNKDYNEIKKNKIKERRKYDINFRISETLRSKIHKLLKGLNLSEKSSKTIGCSKEELKKFLEYQFDDLMNWENYGNYWQIDHVYPINLCNTSINEDIIMCFNWKNLRPLEKNYNRIKSDKLISSEIHNHLNITYNYIKENSLNHEYQKVSEKILWLSKKLKQGKNLGDKIDNPQLRLLKSK